MREEQLKLFNRLKNSENLGVIGSNLGQCMVDILAGFVDRKHVVAITADTTFEKTEDIMRWCERQSMKWLQIRNVDGKGIQVDYNTWYDLLIFLMTNTRFIQPNVWPETNYRFPFQHWQLVYRTAFAKWHCAVPNVDVINELNFPEVA